MQTKIQIKSLNINKIFWRMILAMSRHPFLTFFAGFVASMAVAAGAFAFFYYQLMIQPAAESNELMAKDISAAKACGNVFSTWDQRQKAIDDFAQNKINDPFQNYPLVDQTPK